MSDNENNALVIADGDKALLAQFGGLGVDLAALAQQIDAQSAFGGEGGGGTGLDLRYITQIEISKDGGGRFNYTNPYTGDFHSVKSLYATIVDQDFTITRWRATGEVIEGLDMAKFGKGPICGLAHYTNPDGTQSKNGWYKTPALSAYHATKLNLGDMTGTNGPFGQTPGQKCKDCPLAVQGLEQEKKLCKPYGVLKLILFADEKGQYQVPVYGYLRLSTASLVQMAKDFDEAKKRYHDDLKRRFGFFAPNLLTWRLDARSEQKGEIKYGTLTFHHEGVVNEKLLQMGNEAKKRTMEILEAAAASNTQQAEKPAGFGDSAPPAELNPAKSSKSPF